MSRDERIDYMGRTVFPAMKILFQEYDPTRYADFRCQTCHGEGFDKAAIDFKMPSELEALDPKNPLASGMELDPGLSQFMHTKVLPKMTELIGPSWTLPASLEQQGQSQQAGSGCLHCHPSNDKR
jgi:hypothetical protein